MEYKNIKKFKNDENIILAWKDDEKTWHPYNVITIKNNNKVEFVDPDERISIPYKEFKHLHDEGLFIMVFESVDECQNWCNTQNDNNLGYFGMECDDRYEEIWNNIFNV